jgi:RHS repeat-associated protein
VFIHHFLKIHYLSGAVLIQTTGVADSLYYTYSDAQGSLIALVHDGGSVIQRFAYDPWGVRRDPSNWNVKDSRTSFIINRGYTGHEHLDAFGIINMNGRVYDPLTAQFFSPDPYVQAPGEWLNYNRYGYCMGNPFKYTDPSGQFWNLIVGALIGGTINWIANGAQFSWKGLGYFGVGALAGALSAGIGSGVSSALAKGGTFSAGFWGTSTGMTATSSFWTGAAIGGSSGFSAGLSTGFGNSLIQGQKFDQALWGGFKDGIIGGVTGGLIGGISSGISAVKDGRTFWRGGKIDWNPVAYDISYNNVNIQPQSTGKNACVDNTINNIEMSNGGQSDMGAKVRSAISPNTNPENDPLNVGKAFDNYANSSGAKLVGAVNDPLKSTTDGAYDIIKNGGKLAASIPNSGSDVGHMINIVGATNKIITYGSGQINTTLYYMILNNGSQQLMNASMLTGKGVSLISLFY